MLYLQLAMWRRAQGVGHKEILFQKRMTGLTDASPMLAVQYSFPCAASLTPWAASNKERCDGSVIFCHSER
jgi:hypothetical protein